MPLLSSPKVATSFKLETRWNTNNMGLGLKADVVSSLTAASLVAPLIPIIDRSVMENASGRANLAQILKTSPRNLLFRPRTILFSKPLTLIIMAYCGTYFTANMLDTATSTVQNKPASHVTKGTAKFVSGSAVNIGLDICKDQVYARIFGPESAVAQKVPLSSYALSTLQDCTTIFASFNVPPLLGPYSNRTMSEGISKHVNGQTVAQFAAPALVQVFSTPLHFLGLDLYNRSEQSGVPTPWER
ncbi:hypothetical protein DL768_009326 [Monosporascus sp. mg162]|nr:hypothetical protein DL768_009326 [Monosporascus sp. mg162]